ncbi:unnamed protein product [Moneuplotes crassus]|uniref:EamA domain-containing protein n=1 Tax=Euplotes crassus TaxID=5936 RepID=A0AAD1XFV5_EUPCR|nr:unnamed protein product [Moneuplotes crassus]
MSSASGSILIPDSYTRTQPQSSLKQGIIMAVIAVLSCAVILPFMKLYYEVPASMVCFWRYFLTSVYCIPISLIIWKKKNSEIDYKEVYTLETLKELFLGGFCFALGFYFMVLSADYTLIMHTSAITNTGGILSVVISLIACTQIHRFEIYGTILVCIGVCGFLLDNTSEKMHGETNIILGDFIALFAMPCYLVSYINNAKACKKMPSLIVFHIFMVVQVISFGAYFLLFSKIPWQTLFSDDIKDGFFGWSKPEFIFYSLVIVTPICGIIGTGSGVMLLEYFPAHIVAGIYLLDPFATQVVSVIINLDGYPSLTTCIAAVFITIGLGLSIRGNQLQKLEALLEPSYEAKIALNSVELSEKSVHQNL